MVEGKGFDLLPFRFHTMLRLAGVQNRAESGNIGPQWSPAPPQNSRARRLRQVDLGGRTGFPGTPSLDLSGGPLGILAAAAVFITALAVPLDDPALVVALMLARADDPRRRRLSS
jgi:hypothetical protein